MFKFLSVLTLSLSLLACGGEAPIPNVAKESLTGHYTTLYPRYYYNSVPGAVWIGTGTHYDNATNRVIEVTHSSYSNLSSILWLWKQGSSLPVFVQYGYVTGLSFNCDGKFFDDNGDESYFETPGNRWPGGAETECYSFAAPVGIYCSDTKINSYTVNGITYTCTLDTIRLYGLPDGVNAGTSGHITYYYGDGANGRWVYTAEWHNNAVRSFDGL